jgi:hypothetical protein
MLSGDATPILAFQRVAGNAHELDEMRGESAKIQGRLSVTEDDDELAAIDGFELIPDADDYAETGQTVSQMWTAGDTDVKRRMVRAIKDSWGLALSEHEGQWGFSLLRAG